MATLCVAETTKEEGQKIPNWSSAAGPRMRGWQKWTGISYGLTFWWRTQVWRWALVERGGARGARILKAGPGQWLGGAARSDAGRARQVATVHRPIAPCST